MTTKQADEKEQSDEIEVLTEQPDELEAGNH